jgi:dolichyl-phosphate-mannose--protein O-mannosyl transferase
MTTTRTAVLIVGAVTLLAGVLRFSGLSQPDEKVFDEVYYASDGCWYAGHDYVDCGLDSDSERSWVHPPLGKQAIAVGIDVFGNRPFGWRVMGATAGTASVALVGMLAFLLFGSALWAGVAALVAGTESLLFVQSRIAMLDIFLAFFVVAGFVLLIADRRRQDRRDEALAPPPSPPLEVDVTAGPHEAIPDVEPVAREAGRRRRRPMRMLAGGAFGAAVAVKWSGVLALAAAAILAVAWERTRQRRLGERRPFFRAIHREGVSLYLAFVLAPLVVYLLTWIPWLADRSFDLGELVRHHGQMADYHLGLDTLQENGEPIHPYMSRAWSWLLLLRPVAYFWQGDPSCCEEIIGMGNPFVFWGSLLAIPYLALAWISRREWQAGAVLVPILLQFLPWLVVSRPLFLFYMTPVAPFLALAIVYPIRDLVRSRAPRPLALAGAALVVVVAVGMFVFFHPVLVADRISSEAWQARIWLSSWV